MVMCILLFENCHKKAFPLASEKNKPEPKTVAVGDQKKYGKEIFESECNKCHDLPLPSEHDLAGWNDILPKMIRKAGLGNDKGEMVKVYISSVVKNG